MSRIVETVPVPQDDWSQTQVIIILVLQKISSVLSMLGSGFIVWKIVDPRQQKLGEIYHRIMFCLSVTDIFASIGVFIGDWAMPADSADYKFFHGNVGNQATCDAQGFVIQSGYLSALFYSIFLAAYFLMSVKYNWRESQWKKIEPMLHSAAIIVPAASGAFCLREHLFNPTVRFCWIQSYPINCESSHEIECIRGEEAQKFRLTFMFLPIVMGVFSVFACMTMLCLYVRRIESDALSHSLRWRSNAQSGSGELKKTKQVFQKACWYVGALVLVWSPSMINVVASKVTDVKPWLAFFLQLIAAVVMPSQGLLNAFVYSKFKLHSVIGSSISSMGKRLSFWSEEGRRFSGGNDTYVNEANDQINIDYAEPLDEESERKLNEIETAFNMK